MAYCDDCLFKCSRSCFGIHVSYCRAYNDTEQPIIDAEKKGICNFHLTVKVAKIHASAHNAVFNTLGDPYEWGQSLLKDIKKVAPTLTSPIQGES